MRLTFPRLPRVPRPSWPPRGGGSAESLGQATAELGGALRGFRAAALWGITALIMTAAGSAFAESYRGLWLWAEHHGLAGFWAAAFPLQVDLFVAVGELVLFIAMTDRWGWRDRAGAWTVALLGLAASVAGNVGHVAAHDLQSRGTAAVPPVAAFAALWLGLGVLKRVIRQRDGGTVPMVAEVDETAPSPSPENVSAARFGELLGAVRSLGERVAAMVPSPVPVDAESAALIALRATLAAGNPLTQNGLMEKFGLTRATARKVRDLAYAGSNGHQPDEDQGGEDAQAA